MGLDTRFWGPSGWQLFHLIAHRSKKPNKLLNMMKDILPCKFCRSSTTEFTTAHPLRGDPGKWMYDIHNMVNEKLYKQSFEDKTIVRPGKTPSFEEVKHRYETMKLLAVPGRDFLFSIATNYPEAPLPEDLKRQEDFIHELSEVYPFVSLRAEFKRYLKENPMDVSSQKAYMKWIYGLLESLSGSIDAPIATFRGMSHRARYYTSGCEKKSYHGKTCRRLTGGGYTKSRDHRRTFKVAHNDLL